MRRRDLLTLAAAATPMVVAGRLYAAPQSTSRLLIVFLRGAYDAANVIIPTGGDFYYQSRPTLAVAKPNPADPNAALPLDADWSLHPALKDSILPLWTKGQVAFVPYAGTDDMTRSHFETQDTIEMGQPIGGSRDYNSGFLNRLSASLTGADPIAFTDQLPLSFRGAGRPIPNIAINGVGKPGLDDREAKLIQSMYQGGALGASVTEGFTVRDEVYRTLSAEMVAANRGAVSPKGFSLSARRIGELMREQFNLGFVDVGGWDTHVNEGAATGYLAGRLGELGGGLAAFADAIGPAWSDTTVIVISEFGRTFHENGDRGTDHGHGSTYWVLGGGVKGGRIVGPQVTLSATTLNQGRDYPVLTDYRSLIGGVAGRIYGLDSRRLGAVFPGVGPVDLGLV
jgi:uncharacterized protein (DUF1501 family)